MTQDCRRQQRDEAIKTYLTDDIAVSDLGESPKKRPEWNLTVRESAGAPLCNEPLLSFSCVICGQAGCGASKIDIF
jgi:hypothetical protein